MIFNNLWGFFLDIVKIIYQKNYEAKVRIRTKGLKFLFLNASNKKRCQNMNKFKRLIFAFNATKSCFFVYWMSDSFIWIINSINIVDIHVNTCNSLLDFIFKSKLVSDIENHQSYYSNHNDQNDHHCYHYSSPGTSVSWSV